MRDDLGVDCMCGRNVVVHLAECPEYKCGWAEYPDCGSGHAPIQRKRLLEDTSEKRKQYPIAMGLLDYFPDACAAVAEVSFHGNQKHNPGEPMHHARGKSMDHADCIGRHLIERGGFDGPIRHSAALAWRALALLQEELEAEFKLPLPRGARE